MSKLRHLLEFLRRIAPPPLHRISPPDILVRRDCLLEVRFGANECLKLGDRLIELAVAKKLDAEGEVRTRRLRERLMQLRDCILSPSPRRQDFNGQQYPIIPAPAGRAGWPAVWDWILFIHQELGTPLFQGGRRQIGRKQDGPATAAETLQALLAGIVALIE